MFFLQIIFSLMYAAIIFFLTDQFFEVERFLKVVLVYILVTTVADGLGLILGASLDPIVSQSLDKKQKIQCFNVCFF